MANRIRTELRRFAGGNRYWTISAGIDITIPTLPITVAAKRAGDAEQEAKDYRQLKDAVGFLGEVFGWEEFEVLIKLKETLSELFPSDRRSEGLPRTTLRRLHAIAQEARRAGDILKQSRSGGSVSEISHAVRRGKWTWQAAYALARWP